MTIQFCPNRKRNTRTKTGIVRVLRTKNRYDFTDLKKHKVVVEPKQLPKTGDQATLTWTRSGISNDQTFRQNIKIDLMSIFYGYHCKIGNFVL